LKIKFFLKLSPKKDFKPRPQAGFSFALLKRISMGYFKEISSNYPIGCDKIILNIHFFIEESKSALSVKVISRIIVLLLRRKL